MPEKLQPTEPLEKAIDEFKNAVCEVYESRGLKGISLLLLDNAKNTPVIEASVDDEDGEIKIPNFIDILAKDIFLDTPVLISSVQISIYGVAIEFDSILTSHSTDDRIFIAGNLAADPEITFDMQNKQLIYMMFPIDYTHDPNDSRIQIEARSIEPKTIDDLTKLVRSVGERNYSFITITKDLS